MPILFLDDYRIPKDCYEYLSEVELYMHGKCDTVTDFATFIQYFNHVKQGIREMPTLI